MSDHIFNLIDNPVNWEQSDDSDSVMIGEFDASTVRQTTAGTGVLYFYDEGWSNELVFQQVTPLDLSPGPGQINVAFNRLAQFPCTGIVTSSVEGYLTAPAVKIEVAKGTNIAIMLLSPRNLLHQISVGKTALSVPNEANVTVSIVEGRIQCTGTISSSKFESVRLTLNRNPHLPVFREGYKEDLCRLTQSGNINTVWKPVARTFEESLLVFYPSTIGGDDIRSVATSLGAPLDDWEAPAMVIGDGAFTDYKLQLVVEHRLRTLSDETNLVVI